MQHFLPLAELLVEGDGRGIVPVGLDEEHPSPDGRGERLQSFDQGRGDALAVVGGGNRKVVDVSTGSKLPESADYRTEQALLEILQAPIVGMSHRERVRLALSVHHRYTGGPGGRPAQQIRRLLEPEARERTRQIGLALRLAHTLTGGVGGFLATTRLRRQGEFLRLAVAREGQHYVGEVVLRRLATLAESFGLEPAVDEL